MRAIVLAGLSCLACLGIAPAADLTAIAACTLVPTDWADGDSFLVKTPEGKTHTIRLYGVDCLEWHVSDPTDARRLRSQRRYFGIAAYGGSPQASIDAAKAIGEQAARRVTELLAKPFTVHTTFADGRGDRRFQRIYAFVQTADGKDLSTTLVEEGLARAFGVTRETPQGTSAAEWKQILADLELLAANKRKGVWGLTDWNKLPQERQAERAEEADLAAAYKSSTPEKKSIDINTASREELLSLPRIGEKMVDEIIGKRPYQKNLELLEVPGIGPKTYRQIMPFLTPPGATTPAPSPNKKPGAKAINAVK